MKFPIQLVLILSLLFAQLMARADEPEAPKPDAGKKDFKCSDGYDPDADPRLHPPGQDYRTRQIINAQEQQKHEKQIEDANGGPVEKKPEATGSGTGSGSGQTPSAEPLSTPESDKDKKEKDKEDKDKSKDKKDSDKKAEKETDKDKEKDKEKEKEAAKSDASAKQLAEQKNPLNQAVFAIQSRKYDDSLKFLNLVLAKDQKNQQAHYLMAVSYVGLRKYDQAREEYNIVLKGSSDPKLVQMANQGLARITKQ